MPTQETYAQPTHPSGVAATQDVAVTMQDLAQAPTQHAEDISATPPGKFLTITQAVALVGKSEDTIRRLLAADAVPHRKKYKPNSTKNYSYLIEREGLLSYYAGPTQDVAQIVGTATQMPSSQPTQDVAAPTQTGLDGGGASRSALVQVLNDELERARKEIAETRSQSKAELAEKEQRIRELVDDLISAKAAAGKWEGMAESTQRFNAQLIDRLRLLDHNPTEERVVPTDFSREREVRAESQETRVATVSGRRRFIPIAVFSILVILATGGAYWVASHPGMFGF